MASRYDARGDTPTITRRRHVLACARCRARRVKCDRVQPACSNCAKAGALCQPAQQQLPPPTTSIPSRSSSKHSTDKFRISKLEEEVARLSRSVDSKSPSREPSHSPSPGDSGAIYASETHGKIVSDAESTRYFGPFSWAAIPDEVTDVRTILAPRDGGILESRSPNPGASPILSPVEDPNLPLPNDELHETLLNLFSHRVDPLIRLLHWPSFLERSRNFRRKRSAPEHSQYSSSYFTDSTFGPSHQGLYPNPPIVPSHGHDPYHARASIVCSSSRFLALLFSVYYAAIVSVIDCPSPPDLGPNIDAFSLAEAFKREVTNRVMSVNEKTARAESLEMLQAMVLSLSIDLGSFDLQLQWLQLGATIRMAQGMGVHRDGSNLDLRPLEIELRRRLWAQLCFLDVRYAEQMGREPTILLDSYDTALPLSLSDRDLSDIDEQDLAARQGNETNFKSFQEIERGLERNSPFSPLTFCIVQTEAARLMEHLSFLRYRPKDSIFHAGIRSIAVSRVERMQWINRFEKRLQMVYRLCDFDSTHAMQYLVSEMAGIVVCKAKFITSLLDWREGSHGAGGPERDSETTKLFREATSLAARSLNLIHQYSNTPYSWYTKHFREVYSSSFLAFNLASDHEWGSELTLSAWSVLDQLFPVDSTGRLVEHGLSGSVLGKVLIKARVRRDFRSGDSRSQGLQHQGMHATVRGDHPGYSATMAPHNIPTTGAGMGNFPPSANLFEDFDALMQEPLWSAGLSGVDNPFGSWSMQTLRLSEPSLVLRPRSRPYERPRIYDSPEAELHQTFIDTPSIDSHPQVDMDAEMLSMSNNVGQRSISQHSSPNLADQVLNLGSSQERTLDNEILLEDSSTRETIQTSQLRPPPLRTRDRSVSQPQPLNIKGWMGENAKGMPSTLPMEQERRRPRIISRPRSYYGQTSSLDISPNILRDTFQPHAPLSPELIVSN